MTNARRVDLCALSLLAVSYGSSGLVMAALGQISWMAAGWITFSLLFVVYLFAIPALLRRAYGRVLVVFLPLLLLAALFIASVLWLADLKVAQAVTGLIGGTIVAIGWLVTFLVSSYRDAVDRDRVQRETLIALRSEIFALVDKFDNQPIRVHAEAVQRRILAGGPEGKGGAGEYFPFSTMESAPLVFEAVAASIPSLKSDSTVQAVIRFYAEYPDLRQLIDDTREEKLAKLSRERRVSLHKELTRRRISALRWGLKALTAINSSLEVEDAQEISRSSHNPEISA